MLTEDIPSPPPYNEDTSGEAPPPCYEEDSNKPSPPREDVEAILSLIPGYEHIRTNQAQTERPPSYTESITEIQQNPEQQESRSAPAISESEARQALLEHITQRCCYGNAVVHGLEFSDMKSTTAYSYQLDTFTETRCHKITFVSHYQDGDNVIDGPWQGIPPDLWEIQVDPPTSFTHDIQKEVPVPHTEILKMCFDCSGKAQKLCYLCTDGKVGCGACGGHGGEYAQGYDGDRYFQTCLWCSGRGIRRCSRCDGKGYRRCNTCDGCGQLKFFILLTVKWHTHTDKHLCNDTPLPQKLAAKAKGQVVFKEEFSKLTPVQHSPSVEINRVSEKFIDHHKETFSDEKILKQRHFVRLIPVTHIYYKWKRKTHQFFVYGSDHKVHAPNYPQKYPCTIL